MQKDKDSEITGKVTCTLCKAFVGFARSDGSKPAFDSCFNHPAARIDHPEVAALVAKKKFAEAAKLVKKLKLPSVACPMETPKLAEPPAPAKTEPVFDNDSYFN